ncbi:DNA primase family protein [Avibacterium paragallinarum]|uniref:DNA primase family protein n=1 Tax=Avibacterium paragallinarum TaxID=728 RepID=UPI003987ACB6
MKTKLKNAPFLKDQPNAPLDEMLILAGSEAWNLWGKDGNGEGWALLNDLIHGNRQQKPVILGGDQLEEISRLRLAPENQKFVRICQFGELTQSHINAICLNLAKHSEAETVSLCDNIGQLRENLSDYIARLRNDEEAKQYAEQVAELSEAPQKTAPLDFESEKPTQPEIVEAFLNWTDKPIRQDTNTGKVYEYNGLYWEALSEREQQRKIMLFYKAHKFKKYTARSLKAIADLVAVEVEKLPTASPDFIGFQNGVLNKKTGEFLPHHIEHYLRSVENFDCNIQSKNTPHFDDWLDFVSNESESRKQAILAGLYMVLTNRHEWGLFLEATGVAGAGKSVFSQIASIINGKENTSYISLHELEDDRKRAMLIGKSLAISPDQKPYKGSADELKAITGGDSVTVKLVYVDNFAIKLNPVFMLVTNYPLLFTDRNGGIARRRIIIPFERAIPKEKKDVNFIEKVRGEVYGIVNKLLALFPEPEQARAILEAYKELDEGQGIKREANHLIDFLRHFKLTEERKGALRIGSARSKVLNSAERFGNDTLYSAYLFYCQCHNLNALNLLSFKNALSDAFKEAGEKMPYSEKMYNGYPTSNAHWKHRELSVRQWEG